MLQQPYDLYKAGWADNYMMGLVNQVAQALDDGVTQEVTNHLFEEPGKKFGMDLAAINMQRGREHGIPGYGKYDLEQYEGGSMLDCYFQMERLVWIRIC